MQCPICRAENPDDGWSCINCRAQLDSTPPPPPPPTPTPPAAVPPCDAATDNSVDGPSSDTRPCGNCDASIPSTDAECPYCFTPQSCENAPAGVRLSLDGSEIDIDSEVIIGRDQDQGFGACLSAYDVVSRRHLRVRWDGAVGLVSDLGSTNGTYCDGKRILPDEEVVLRVGMAIRMGTTGPVIIVQRVGG